MFTLRTAIIYSLSVLIPFALDNSLEILNIDDQGTNRSLLKPIHLYQWIVTAGPRKPRPHFVRVILLDPSTDPVDVVSETSPCNQRDFMARLLTAVAAGQPSVIAIDKFYPTDTCTNDQTKDLVAAMRSVSARIPVIVLYRDLAAVDLQAASSEKTKVLEDKGAVVAFTGIDFGPNVFYSLKALNRDERKIPLSWPAFAGSDFDVHTAAQLARENPKQRETFSVAAVRQQDPGTLTGQALRWFLQRNLHPYTSFLGESELVGDSAVDLICGKTNSRSEDWRNKCLSVDPTAQSLRNLRNKVVVIGQNASSDVHQTVIGSVPGVILQANYIESLLDDRFLKPTPIWLQVIISIGWLGVVEWLFRRFESHPAKALLLSALAIGSLALLTYDIAVLQLGRYIVLWPPGVAAMIGRYVDIKLAKASAAKPSAPKAPTTPLPPPVPTTPTPQVP
jgi:CHASE2 domain-containing sensor protein